MELFPVTPGCSRPMDSHKQRSRARSVVPRPLAAIPVHPSNWAEVLNALLIEHNHRHASKQKDVSFKTAHERREFLFRFFRAFNQRHLHLDPRSLGNRHVQSAVNVWLMQGLAAPTIQTYLSFLRAFADWIGKHGMVREAGFYISDPSRFRRSYVARTDKSWTSRGVEPGALIARVSEYDRYAGVWLSVMSAFGLRVKETQM